MPDALIQMRGITKRFGGVTALQNVDLDANAGEVLAILGESGSGKSTVARCIVRLTDADDGKIILNGTDLRPLGRNAMRQYRAKLQMVFQDPFASLNPRTKVGKIIAQGPLIQGISKKRSSGTSAGAIVYSGSG